MGKGATPQIPYMIDQSHIDKPKIEAMIQTAVTAQELFVKAAAVDHEKLAVHQQRNEQVDAEECLRAAFFADVRPPLSNGEKNITYHWILSPPFAKAAMNTRWQERKARRAELGITNSGSYA